MMSLKAGNGKKTKISFEETQHTLLQPIEKDLDDDKNDKENTKEEEKEINEAVTMKIDEIDFEALKSLEKEGIGMSFLENLQELYNQGELNSSRDTKSNNGKASNHNRKVMQALTDDKKDTVEQPEYMDTEVEQSKDNLAGKINKIEKEIEELEREIDEMVDNESVIVKKKKQRGKKVKKAKVENKNVDKTSSKVTESDKVSDKKGKHGKRSSRNETHAYNCEKCSFKGKSKNGLIIHKKRIHKIKQKCDECEFEADKLRYITLHKRKHAAEPQFECPICFKKYPQDSSLTRHKRSAHGPNGNNTCEKCQQTFKLKETLRVHMGRIHKEGSFKKKEHRCETCNYVTDRLGCLTKHIVKKHAK